VKAGNVTFKALVTKKSLVDLGVREGLDVFVSFDTVSVHSLYEPDPCLFPFKRPSTDSFSMQAIGPNPKEPYARPAGRA